MKMLLGHEWVDREDTIDVRDPFDRMQDDEAGLYASWRDDDRTQFDYIQSIPLGRTLARHILAGAGKSADEINPMSARPRVIRSWSVSR